MNSNKLIAICALLTLLILSTLYLVHNQGKSGSEGFKMADTVFVEHTDTIQMWDTLKITEVKPKIIEKLRVDTVYSKEGEPIELVTEHKKYEETIINDSDTANVAVYTSGVNTEVDSISLMFNRREIVHTNTVEITKWKEKKKKLFSVQPQATFGYDPLNRQWGCVIGIGVGVNL